LALVIDDLQWCDSETLAWLRYLLRYAPQSRLLIVGGWRSEAVDESHPLTVLLRDLSSANQLTVIELGPLSADESMALAQNVAQQRLDDQATQRIVQFSEGHPLMLVEAVRTHQADWSDDLGDRRDQVLAPKMPAILQARLAQLSPPARVLAGLAATIGRQFDWSLFQRASGLDEDALVRALDELWQRRIVREQGAAAYDFSHDKIRETAYQSMSLRRRQLQHQRVAEALVQGEATRVDEVSAQVAAHYEQAALFEQAGCYWRRAAEQATAHFAQREALDYFSRALACTPSTDLPQRAGLLLARIKLYNHQGLRNEAQRDLAELRALLDDLDDGAQTAIRRRAEFALSLSDFGRGIGDRTMAQAAASSAALLAERCGADDLAAHAYLYWGDSDIGSLEQFAQARLHLEKALTFAHTAGLRQVEGEAYSLLGLHGLYAGRPVDAIEADLQRSLAVYQQLGDPAGEAGALGMLAYLIYTQREGNYDLGIRYCERALALVMDGWDAERFAVGNLGFLLYYQGDYGRAKPYLERQLAIVQQAQNWGSEAGALLELGSLQQAMGQYTLAQDYFERAWQLYREHDAQQQYRVKSEGLLALFYHLIGDQARASICAEAALRFARQLNDPRVQGDAFVRCGRVFAGEGRLDEAAELFQQALACFRQMEQTNHTLMALAGLAVVALQRGKPVQAQSWVEPILAKLQTQPLDRTDEELYVYMTGFQVLCAGNDERAAHLLQLAYHHLETCALSLADEQTRRIFWAAPLHAEVIAEMKQRC
jgi:predicted ATPase